MAAWLWHWYLNDAYDVFPTPGSIRKSAQRAFPYNSTKGMSIGYQGQARTIHNRLQRHPPKVNYE